MPENKPQSSETEIDTSTHTETEPQENLLLEFDPAIFSIFSLASTQEGSGKILDPGGYDPDIPPGSYMTSRIPLGFDEDGNIRWL